MRMEQTETGRQGRKLDQAVQNWHSESVTLSAAKDLSERFFALLRMTRLAGRIVMRANVKYFGLGSPARPLTHSPALPFLFLEG
jgi:hypothetical protein